MRLALVLNARSGSIGDPDALVAAVGAHCEHLSVHAPGEEAAALATQPDRLVVAGGDGTIAASFAASQRAGIPLAVLPGGTANDFARALGLPLELEPAIALATDPAARLQTCWGGLLGERPFVNVASVGLSVDAADAAEQLKPKLGPAAYAAGALRAGLTARRVRASLAVDGTTVRHGHVWQLLVGASGRFGGGSGLGEAALSERPLVAAWVPGGTRLTLPFRALGLRRRTLEQQPGVQWWPGHELVVEAGSRGRPAQWNVDGELWQAPSKRLVLRPLGPVAVVVGAR